MTSIDLPIIDIEKEGLEKVPSLLSEYGFVRIDHVFKEDEVAEMQTRINDIVKNMNPQEHSKVIFTSDGKAPKNAWDRYFVDSSDKIRFFYEDEVFDENGQLNIEKEKAINKVGHALHWYDPVFKKYSFSPIVKDVARKLELKDPHLVQSMYIFKQPSVGGRVHEHVDSTYLRLEPTSEKKHHIGNALLGVWIAIDDATLENGCLWFIPGSHKTYNAHDYRFVRNDSGNPDEPLLKYIGEKPEFDDSLFVPVPVPRGSMVLIDGKVVHKSEKNTSSISRHAYTFHLADKDGYEWSLKNWPQETPTYKFPELYSN